ncbi:MAG: Putative multidrug export ATP-binding/permease protein [Bacteroidota bacterium]|nr:MAG: Putative multidrug export ATP-binding/permease protein [Bacteroidota bacterium]
MSPIRYILRYALPYKGYIGLNIFCNLLYAIFNALSFIALWPMLEVLFGGEKTPTEKPSYEGTGELLNYALDSFRYSVGQYAQDDPLKALMIVIGVLLISFFLKNVFNYAGIFFITYMRNGVVKDLQNTLYAKLISFSAHFHSDNKKGDSLARITSDVVEVQRSFLSVLEMLIREPLTILFALGSMFFISTKLTLFVLVFIPVAAWLISIIGKSLKSRSERVQREFGELLSYVEESLSGIRIIQVFTAESNFNQKFAKITKRLFSFSNNLTHRQSLASPMSEFLGIAVFGVILYFGGRLVLIEQTLTGEAFITYLGLAYGVLTPAKSMSRAIYSVRKGNAAAQRIMEYLFYKSEIQSPKNPKKIPAFSNEISFNNIHFNYGDEKVINGLDLKISKGKSVALVGPSGSGKTTIANLLARFYDPQKGNITIDGIAIKDVNLDELRTLFGYVTQDSILFHDTVKNNLLIARPSASDTDLADALAIANAGTFVEELPQGINTVIGDAGNKLSGGQKQRLAIARAVLKNPPVMILDEATSALDTESEKLVQDALQKMMQNRTSLVIAHRLSTIKSADEIIVLDKGNVLERGTHKTLLAQNGMYKKLIDLQSFN